MVYVIVFSNLSVPILEFSAPLLALLYAELFQGKLLLRCYSLDFLSQLMRLCRQVSSVKSSCKKI
jgi:hypothetical protein